MLVERESVIGPRDTGRQTSLVEPERVVARLEGRREAQRGRASSSADLQIGRSIFASARLSNSRNRRAHRIKDAETLDELPLAQRRQLSRPKGKDGFHQLLQTRPRVNIVLTAFAGVSIERSKECREELEVRVGRQDADHVLLRIGTTV